jgi:hypothetical protein
MLRERWISMQAVDRQANIFRSWQCEVGTDLFGIVLLSVTFGEGCGRSKQIGPPASAKARDRQMAGWRGLPHNCERRF